MTEREALKILELSPDAGEREIKTKYRQLIRQVHPDIHGSSEERYTRHAQRINHAYAVLKKRFAGNADTPQARGKTSSQSPAKKEAGAWSAPINSHAYTEREILHYAEDSNGSVLGSFPIARGSICGKQMRIFRYSCSAFTSAAKNCWMKSTWSSAEKNLPRIAGRFTVN